MKRPSILMRTDSYKPSHRVETYPPNAEAIESYVEARSGSYISFVGLMLWIEDNLLTPFTQNDLDVATKFYAKHGEPFDHGMWQYVLDTYNGYLPIEIQSVSEGITVPNRNILFKVRCSDKRCFPVASFIEPNILPGVWPTSSVATISLEIKLLIKKFKNKTSDTPFATAFDLNDFGTRAATKPQIGMGHLIHFQGSDNVEAIWRTNESFDCEMSGFSIPASEHSVITSWGKDRESECYKNFLDLYLKSGSMCACVSDSYDIMNAVKIWGTDHHDQIVNSGGTLVVRPDSGDPVSTPVAVVEELTKYFGYIVNSKGYKVLPPCIRVIQGDGINRSSIEDILSLLEFKGYSSDNICFGMGGALLDGAVRDTYGWAMKCSAIKIDGEWQDVFKEAPGKASKKGRLELVKVNGEYQTRKQEDCGWKDDEIIEYCLKPAFYLIKNEDGKYAPWYRKYTLDEIRKNAEV